MTVIHEYIKIPINLGILSKIFNDILIENCQIYFSIFISKILPQDKLK